LGLAFQLLLAERRQGHAEKADAFCDREQWLEQRVAKLLDFGSRRQERLTGRLRVICWKSAYFTFSVTVRPLPLAARGQLELIRCRAGESADLEVEACDAKVHRPAAKDIGRRRASG
jgi:hypothetical protein